MASKKGKYEQKVADTIREIAGGFTGTKVGRVAEEFSKSLTETQRKAFLDAFEAKRSKEGDFMAMILASNEAGAAYSVAGKLGTHSADDRKVPVMRPSRAKRK
jgi:hypothetical protein